MIKTMEYKAKYTVNAVQWNGEVTPEIEELFKDLDNTSINESEEYEDEAVITFLDTDGLPTELAVTTIGNWIVVKPDGYISIYPNDYFITNYGE
jgi:hypothetical protein